MSVWDRSRDSTHRISFLEHKMSLFVWSMNRQSPTEEVLIYQDDLMTQDSRKQSFIDSRWVQLSRDHCYLAAYMAHYDTNSTLWSKIETLALALALELKKMKDSQIENVLEKWLSHARVHRAINLIYSWNNQSLS